MAGILLIIFVAYIYSTSKKIDKLEKENLSLKKEIKTLKENNITNNESEHSTTIVTKAEPTAKRVINEKKKVDPKEQKNTSILITGAILIILAAIVFLTSTWTSIPNLLKTLVIILLAGVFFGASKIAKNKFQLEKTSNTFFYMAMAYIPIGLISCSIFGLFGEFLAIYGDGNYIYLTGTAIITAVIYFISYKNNQSKGLICASLISQISAVILFSLIFEYSVELILINILLYNICLLFLSQNKDIEKIEFIKNIYKGIAYVAGFVTLFYLENVSLQVVSILMLLAINFIILYRKKENVKLNAYLFNITVYVLGMYWINSDVFNENLKILLQICYILVVFVIEQLLLRNTKNEYLQKSSIVISIINMALIYVFYDYSEMFIKPFVVAIIEEILLLIAFVEAKEKGKLLLSYLIPGCLILIGCNFIGEIKPVYHNYIIFAILLFISGEFIKNKNLNAGFFIVSHVFMGISYLVVSVIKPEFLNDVIYFIILLAIYSYSFWKNKDVRIFKYFSYIAGSICLYSCANFLSLEDNAILLIPTISAIGIRLLESKYEFLKDEFSKIFRIIYEVIAYISLFSIDTDSRVVFTTLFVIYLSGISIYKRKISLETISSGIYLFASIGNFESIYVQEIFCLIWAGLHYYFYTNNNEKDIFRGILYICGLVLYNTILAELGIDKYYSFTMIGITVIALLFTKTIIYKYVKELDSIEYILFSLIYFYSLCSYANEKDGMIYVFALVCLLMYCYTKKYGAIFIVTTLAIIINAIALTREFWLSVPWWIYLLLIGTVLIGFAIKNESNENKEKITVGKVVKKIKDGIEK